MNTILFMGEKKMEIEVSAKAHQLLLQCPVAGSELS